MIWVPPTYEARQQEAQRFQQMKSDWDAAHQHCPDCGRHKSEMLTTTMGWSGIEDPNKVNCGCGFSGKVKDLVNS